MILNIAHRGARSVAPENTLIAAQKGYDLGAHMWETDIVISKDEKFIIFHNDDMSLTTDAESRFPDRKPWMFTDFTLEEIKRLDAGSWFVSADPHGQIEQGNVSSHDQESFKGVEVPTLTEALQFTQKLNWKINLELKQLPDAKKDFPFVDNFLKEIERARISTDHFLVSSFRHDWLLEIRDKRPDIELQALLGYSGKPPVDWGGFKFDTYNVSKTATTPEEVKQVTARGVKVNLYTVNDKKDMIELIEAGAGGLITDFPQTLRDLGYARS